MGDLNPDTLANLKVTELKAELKKRGLPIAGLKAVLVDRLRESLTETEEEEPAEEKEEEAEATEKPSAEEPKADATTEGPAAEEPEAVAEGTIVVAQEEPAVAEESGATTAAEETQGDSGEPNGSTTEQPKDTATEEPKEVAPEEPKETISEEHTTEEPRVDTAPDEDAPPPQESEFAAPMEVDEQPPVPGQSEPAHEAVAEAQAAEPLPESSSVAQPAADASPETKMVDADPSPETEMTDAAPVPTTSEPAPESTLTVGDARPTIPSPLPADTPPIVLTTADPMDTSDPDTLKRKRRSPSPPPPSIPETTETQDTISPPTTKKTKTSSSPPASPRRQPPPPRDARFTHLVDAPIYTSPPADSAADEPPITPSIHPATRALYIRNFIRPLNEVALRRHILTLATPAGASPDAATIESFFLDTIKSHCFIVFANLSAASRVRRDIHGKVFPNERTRKPLWADFVPEEEVAKWVEQEKAGSGGINKWEVVYDTQGEEVSVELVKNGQPAVTRERGKSVDISGAPSGPKGNVRQERAPKRVVMDLDQLFMSTQTKPKLYYLPVDREIARERLAKVNRDLKGRY